MNVKQIKLKFDDVINTLSVGAIIKYAVLSLIVFVFAITTMDRENELAKSDTPIENLVTASTSETLVVNDLN